MTAERQLFEALKRFTSDRGYPLSDGPMDEVVIPIGNNGGTLHVSILLLETHSEEGE
jgi:hypothetical protein